MPIITYLSENTENLLIVHHSGKWARCRVLGSEWLGQNLYRQQWEAAWIFVLCKSALYVPIHFDINCKALSNIHIQGKFAAPTDCSESDINNLKTSPDFGAIILPGGRKN